VLVVAVSKRFSACSLDLLEMFVPLLYQRVFLHSLRSLIG